MGCHDPDWSIEPSGVACAYETPSTRRVCCQHGDNDPVSSRALSRKKPRTHVDRLVGLAPHPASSLTVMLEYAIVRARLARALARGGPLASRAVRDSLERERERERCSLSRERGVSPFRSPFRVDTGFPYTPRRIEAFEIRDSTSACECAGDAGIQRIFQKVSRGPFMCAGTRKPFIAPVCFGLFFFAVFLLFFLAPVPFFDVSDFF